MPKIYYEFLLPQPRYSAVSLVSMLLKEVVTKMPWNLSERSMKTLNIVTGWLAVTVLVILLIGLSNG